MGLLFLYLHSNSCISFYIWESKIPLLSNRGGFYYTLFILLSHILVCCKKNRLEHLLRCFQRRVLCNNTWFWLLELLSTYFTLEPFVIVPTSLYPEPFQHILLWERYTLYPNLSAPEVTFFQLTVILPFVAFAFGLVGFSRSLLWKL